MKDGRIFIQGVAVKEGISKNNRKYIAKELNKFAATLIGRPILKDHESMTDNIIGKVTEAESVEKGKYVTYKGWVKGSDVIEKLKDGRISEVSIGAMSKRIVKEDKDDDFIIPVDMTALELSTTPTPGVDGTSMIISNGQEEKYSEEQLKEMITRHIIEQEDDEDEENNEEEISKNNSQSLSLDDNINKIRKEENMKTEDNAISTKENVELLAMTEELNSIKVKLKEAEDAKDEAEKNKKEAEDEAEEAKESLRIDAISKYEEKAKSKGAKVLNLSKSNMEAVKFAIEMVDSMPEPKAEEEPKVEEPEVEEPKVEEPKVEEPAKEEDNKPEEKAKLRTKEVNSSVPSVAESLKGYTVTQEDCSKGFAFYRNY